MNKRLLYAFIFIAIFSVVYAILIDDITGILHFGWKSGEDILRSKLQDVKKIEFVNRVDS